MPATRYKDGLAKAGKSGVNSSGMLYTDAGLVSFLVYVFWGGWVVTLAGEALSIMVMRQPGRLVVGLALAIGCLAPLAYVLLWALLDRFAPIQPSSSDASTYVVMAGLAGCVFAAPLAALVHVRARRDVKTPHPD
ncbi:hypothetical protein [Caulobacter sp. DWR1-3-2b1]|uniref:hypothetical protein n=1 Tax=Caulobacter sp. DWR1-3-2b1 TaxID=2804670 RepID=UPI003CFA1B2B